MSSATKSTVFTFLTFTCGKRIGEHVMLEGAKEFRIGRGLDCHVVLEDPLCSRVHCIVYTTSDGWFLRDSNSRNGTFVNGQKIDEARLLDGSTIRIGSDEFLFRQANARPTSPGDVATQTLERFKCDTPMASTGDTSHLIVSALKESEKAKDFLLLHQLSVKLLGCDDPDQVIRTSLELLHDRCQASKVGFLWLDDDGQLKRKFVIPEDTNDFSLSKTLTEKVSVQRHAVWVGREAIVSSQKSTSDKLPAVGNTPFDSTAKPGLGELSVNLRQISDAICVPLLHNGNLVGAIHLYQEEGSFPQLTFEFAISVANILVVALVRARQQASLAADHQRLVAQSGNFSELIGESKPMLDLKSKITRIARASGSVLVRGESGAGKELVARAIHRSSSRANLPLLCVNCAAIPRDLMESQLFGHKKGSFTGAETDHVGWFRQADSGTLFLDEVGEMTLEGQAKLLRILEGHPFMPVGDVKEVKVDVRVIAATNRDLRDFVREGKFREDLYYRLSVFELYVPPLRERGPDIELLINFFLEHFKRQHGRRELRLSDAARQKLLGYQWPGNVRQLRNVIDSCVVMAEGAIIQPEDLGLRDMSGNGELETLNIEHWERKLIREALGRSGGNVPEAAKLLGIGRATLYRKMQEYAIDR